MDHHITRGASWPYAETVKQNGWPVDINGAVAEFRIKRTMDEANSSAIIFRTSADDGIVFTNPDAGNLSLTLTPTETLLLPSTRSRLVYVLTVLDLTGVLSIVDMGTIVTAPYYVGQAELEAAFGAERVAQVFSVQRSDGTTTGVASSNAMTVAIAHACAEIDEILGDMYSVPFAVPVPPSISEIATIIVMRRGIFRRPELWDGPKTPLELEYQDAIKRLREIRLGKRKLSSDLIASNEGGEVGLMPYEGGPVSYFLPDPTTGSGGMVGY